MRLGAWELLTGWTGGGDRDFAPRIALQMVHESALCTNRVRRKNSLAHQGFALAGGLSELISDEQAHRLLDGYSTEQVRELLVNLGWQRRLAGHYTGNVVAVDPHRIISHSRRVMAKKKKNPDVSPQKMLQTFFSVCAETGQPIMAGMASTGTPAGLATNTLLEATHQILDHPMLVVADKEHFTEDLMLLAHHHSELDLLVPALHTNRIKAMMSQLSYQRQWAGYAIAEQPFTFKGSTETFRLLAQRTGEIPAEYEYCGFVTTSDQPAASLLCQDYPKRWSVEEFYRFENKMGLNRASTMNLHIRYGKLALAMIAQAATYQLRTKLNTPYRKWDAEHLAREVLAWAEGDVRVNNDTILVTFYGAPKHINPADYINLPAILEADGIDPRIPWLYNFKLDFRFK